MEERKGEYTVHRTRREQSIGFTVRRKKSVTKEAKEEVIGRGRTENRA